MALSRISLEISTGDSCSWRIPVIFLWKFPGYSTKSSPEFPPGFPRELSYEFPGNSLEIHLLVLIQVFFRNSYSSSPDSLSGVLRELIQDIPKNPLRSSAGIPSIIRQKLLFIQDFSENSHRIPPRILSEVPRNSFWSSPGSSSSSPPRQPVIV